METIFLDDGAGTTAAVLPGLGFNCYRFQSLVGGKTIDVLWSEPGFETGQKRPSGSGIPILFPFPGRIPGTRLVYEGREYPLEAGDGRGNAIHGFVLNRPWRVVEQSATRVVGQFQAAADDPALLDRWPADFRISVAYSISAGQLAILTTIDNPSDKPLPFGFGLHPYFRVPLGGSSADECVVRVPARSYWEQIEMRPTGQRLPASSLLKKGTGTSLGASPLFQQAAESRGPLVTGMKFADTRFDDVFADLDFTAGQCRASLHDPGSGVTMALSFDEPLRECVVYNPPHREAICIEPYTCVPGAIAMQGRGLDTGLLRLSPGETFRAAATISALLE